MKNIGYIYKKNRLKLTSLNIVFHIGSAYEKEGFRGTSHLMEHLITKSIDPYQDKFLQDCIDFNAYTSANYVVVYFRGLDNKLTPELKRELTNKLLTGITDLTEEQFNNEKNIVIQEIMDGFENPTDGHFNNILYSHYNITLPLGLPNEVAKFSFKEYKKLAKAYFTKPIRIVEVGPTKTDFSKIKYNSVMPETVKIKWKPTKNIIKDVPKGDKTLVFGMGKKIVKRSDYVMMEIGLNALFSGLSSPFYQEIREKRGLSYYINGNMFMFDNNNILAINACTTEEHVKELSDIILNMCNNIKKYLTKERFNITISQFTTAQEVEKCLQYKNIGEIIAAELPKLPKKFDKIDYKKTVETVEKYMKEIVILTR